MPDLSKYPARVTRCVAMELLSVKDDETFRKVIDANPDLAHTLPGETKAKYLLVVIARLLEPNKSRCATGFLEGNKSPKSNVQCPKASADAAKPKRTS
jgi:hypothetical protein